MLKFRRIHPDAKPPVRANRFDAGLDLCCVEDVELESGEWAAVPTGLQVAIPPGKVGLVFPRSGNAAKFGVNLKNCVGVIDSGYRGELKVLLANESPQVFACKAGERIAQLVIVDCDLTRPEEVDELPAPPDSRGEGGFGSTGLAAR